MQRFVAGEIHKALMPLQRRLDHLQRRVTMLEIAARGREMREQVSLHESELEDD
jgi:hypothetical protein